MFQPAQAHIEHSQLIGQQRCIGVLSQGRVIHALHGSLPQLYTLHVATTELIEDVQGICCAYQAWRVSTLDRPEPGRPHIVELCGDLSCGLELPATTHSLVTLA